MMLWEYNTFITKERIMIDLEIVQAIQELKLSSKTTCCRVWLHGLFMDIDVAMDKLYEDIEISRPAMHIPIKE